jgi:hypothetical protein
VVAVGIRRRLMCVVHSRRLEQGTVAGSVLFELSPAALQSLLLPPCLPKSRQKETIYSIVQPFFVVVGVSGLKNFLVTV